jgi:fatty-acyl-CoA synthase
VATPFQVLTAAGLLDAAESLAGYLHSRGIDRSPIALMGFNRPEVVTAFFGALVLGASPTNINPRYTADDVAYLLSDCDATVIIHERCCTQVVSEALATVSRPLLALEIGSPAWMEAITCQDRVDRARSGEDRLRIHSGTSTGFGRPAEWCVDDHYRVIWQMVNRTTPPPTPEFIAESGRNAPTTLLCSPILRGEGLSLMLNTLNGGGAVVLAENRSFDAAGSLALARQREVWALGIVGDAVARPLLTELETGHWSGRLPTLRAIFCAGAGLSSPVREGLAHLLPGVQLIRTCPHPKPSSFPTPPAAGPSRQTPT